MHYFVIGQLILSQITDSTLQPLTGGKLSYVSTIVVNQHLSHVPDQVLPLLGVKEEAVSISDFTSYTWSTHI